MKFLIMDYIKQIKPLDIKNFAYMNGINLSDIEVMNLFGLLKDKNILNYSDNEYENMLKKSVDSNNFFKAKSLLFEYKKKYQNYL